MSEPFVGEIRMVGFNYAPANWALCNGQLLSISQNATLFNLLGTTYGGDGVSTFALPDLRSRVPIHAGQGTGLSPYVQGENGGSETVTLLTSQIPSHNHGVNCSTGGGTQPSPANGYPAVESTGTSMDYDASSNGTMNTAMIGNAGGGQAHANIQPYLCVNFIIALSGIFPSRS
jgi:microcystin-dependent protein